MRLNYHLNDVFTEISYEFEAKYEPFVCHNQVFCAVNGCSSKSTLNCVMCMKNYCYEHLHLDLHNLKNVGIIKHLQIL